MQPHQSFRIWFTQRSGSTLLCQGLTDTGVAGQPGEFFNLPVGETLQDKYGVHSYPDFREKLWELGTSPNGVFGIIHSIHHTYYRYLLGQIASLDGAPAYREENPESVLADLFPNCKHIYLTRRNKIRQAVSWWKAIKDDVWHLQPGQTQAQAQAFYEQHYDFGAIFHLFKEANLKECTLQDQFDQYDIRPLVVVYEDMVKSFAGTLRRICDYLDLEAPRIMPSKGLKRTANQWSEQWVQRFRKEFQETMPDRVW
jgi:LPS sulfotransferase NodH